MVDAYLSGVSCSGVKPARVAYYEHELSASLFKTVRSNRGMPCFLVAPAGMGKTAFAMAYARRFFAFRNVYWFDGSDERFRRILDDGSLQDFLIGGGRSATRQPGLAVIDDLPLLGEQHAHLLSDLIDALIDAEWEVFILALPSHDSLGTLQTDRLCITGKRLLAGAMPHQTQVEYCLHGFFEEGLPLEFRSLAAAMLLLQKGKVEDLETLKLQCRQDVVKFLASAYPMFGINVRQSTFSTWHIEPALIRAEIHDSLLLPLPSDAAEVEGDGDGALDYRRLAALAEYLIRQGRSRRAYEVLELGREQRECDTGCSVAGVVPLGVHPVSADACAPSFSPSVPVFPSTDVSVMADGCLVAPALGAVSALPAADAPVAAADMRYVSTTTHPLSIDAWTLSPPSPFAPPETYGSSACRPPSSSSPPFAVNERFEPMYVRLFGGIEVVIGERSIREQDWTKNKSKTLFTYLLLGFGREIARASIIEQLWPDMDSRHAIDNFYVTWSLMRKTLQNSQGDCPYIYRTGSMCKVDARFVTSDVVEFERLARAILFERNDPDVLIATFLEMESLYRGDLFTGGSGCSTLENAQTRYRSLLVDTMLSAAEWLLENNNLIGSLWFARKAFDNDPSREDVYRILMKVQALSGQRTSAIETYFACKQYLAEQFGIAPSEQTILLYEQLIMENSKARVLSSKWG